MNNLFRWRSLKRRQTVPANETKEPEERCTAAEESPISMPKNSSLDNGDQTLRMIFGHTGSHKHTSMSTNANHSFSLGIGVFSRQGFVESFVSSSPPAVRPLVIKRNASLEEITTTLSEQSSEISDTTTATATARPCIRESSREQEQPIQLNNLVRRSSSFLRAADLALPSSRGSRRPDPSGSCRPDPSESDRHDRHQDEYNNHNNIIHNAEENWIAMDDGIGGPSPMAAMAVQALFDYAKTVILNPAIWTPDAKTQKILSDHHNNNNNCTGDNPFGWQNTTFSSQNQDLRITAVMAGENNTYDDTILVWSGKFDHGYYGHDIPAIRSAAIVPMSALSLLELLIDSSRVKEYNAMSNGRTDDLVLFPTADDPPWGDRSHNAVICTKVMTSQTKLPMIRKTVSFTSLLHARQDHDHHHPHEVESSSSSSSYYLITRGVTQPQLLEPVSSEILLGINRIQPISDNACLLISVNHVKSSLIPMMIAKRIGLQAAVNFIQDLRKCCG